MRTSRAWRFWLEDEEREMVALNGEHGIFLDDVSGLGIEENVSFGAVANGFFTNMKAVRGKQNTISGALYFLGVNPEENYRQLLGWMLAARELRLVYMPPFRADRYRRRVQLVSLEKGDRESPVRLKTRLRVAAMSPWALSDTMTATYEQTGSAPFRVGVNQVGVDRLSSGCEYRYTVTVRPRGHLPASFGVKVSTSGRITDPVISVVGKKTGTEYGRCALTCTITSGAVLELSSEPGACYVREWQGTTERDLLQYADLRYDPFPLLPLTEPCEVALRSSTVINGEMTVTARQYVRSV